MSRSRQWRLLAVAALSLTSVSACAAPRGSAGPGQDGNNDPYEDINRKVWSFDITLDQYFLRPIADGYKFIAPQFVQTAINNALTNMKNPTIFANDILQGNFGKAGQTFARLTLNTVFGLGGFIDTGTMAKIPFHEADFGQTLGVWGVPAGPYLVLPLLGPSDPRDAVGYGVDSFADPFSIEMHAHNMDDANYIRTAVDVINTRAQTGDQLDELKKSSLDFYAAVRSLYQQQRDAAVAAGVAGSNPPTPVVPYQEEPNSPVPSKVPPPSASGRP